MGTGRIRKQERKELEVGVLKKQEAGEIGVNYATMLKGWLPSKRAKLSKKKRGRRQNLQSTGRGRFNFKRGGLSLMTVIIYYGNVWYV